MASMRGHNETVQVLLSDPNIDIDIGHVTKGETPFSIASERSQFDVMALLIKGKWTLDGWLNDNWTPLHMKLKPITLTEPHIPTSPILNGNKMRDNWVLLYDGGPAKFMPGFYMVLSYSEGL